MFKRLQEVSSELFAIRNELNVKGKSVGWDWDLLPYTIKEGCTTYIGAAPASGKTELWFEFLINSRIASGFMPATLDTSSRYLFCVDISKPKHTAAV